MSTENIMEYSVYARVDQKNRVTKIFSTCFEQPLESDILIKSGHGDEFIHVGYYEIFTKEGAYAYKIENGELVEFTEEEIKEETKTDSSAGNVNELESYSDGKLITAGWYRIAKYPGREGSAYANSCEIVIKRARGEIESEYHNLKLISVSSLYEFKSITDKCGVQLIDQIRYTYDDNNGYLEIHYKGDTEEAVHISIIKAKDYNYKWTATVPELTEEEIEGVDVVALYNLPDNADPLTNLDSAPDSEKLGGKAAKDYLLSADAKKMIQDFTESGNASMCPCITTFNDDGSITETFAQGSKITVFNDDGSITETLKDVKGKTLLVKNTTFSDNEIREEVTS